MECYWRPLTIGVVTCDNVTTPSSLYCLVPTHLTANTGTTGILLASLDACH